MLATVFAAFVAVLHVGFMVLESLLWTQPMGRKIFRMSAEKAETTKVLASNQGAYNGMLAVGIAWALLVGNGPALAFLLFFVVIVGIYGALTVSPTIFVVQALPAIIALGLMRAGL